MSVPWRTLSLGGLAVASLVVTTMVAMPTRLVWNASKSVPVGLYAVRPVERLAVTDLALARPPQPLSLFLADGGYLPAGVPLLKRVAALPGHTVCRNDLTVTVNGAVWAAARERDRRGRSLPVWHGCREIADGEVFLLNCDNPDSLDGRYFGPIPRSAIVGRAAPVWTDEER